MCAAGQRFTLPDGRELGYDDHGPESGIPVFFFHGTPSSRYDWYLFGSQALTRKLGVRVLAPDRPGLGLSDLQPNRRIRDWAADVAALADGLGLDRFAVLGYSGGGPYVLACALEFPERLTSAGAVSSTGAYDGPGPTAGIVPTVLAFLGLARERPGLARAALRLMGALVRRAPRALIAEALAVAPPPDRQILSRPVVERALVDAFLEAVRQGPRGASVDTALMISPWGFDPADVAAPVHLWHGESDHFVSPAAVRHLAQTLPNGQPRFYPREGHVSLLVNQAEEILSDLVYGSRPEKPVVAPAAERALP